MTQVVVPVRYPLSEHSKATLSRAIEIVEERGGQLSVLHVNQYQDNHKPTRRDLKDAVEREFGRLPDTRYVVRQGLLVEETLLDEIVAENADIVVIGKKQAGRWRRMIRRLVDDPDIETFLREELDCDVVTAER
ncbi:universal stress protein [Halosimplex litoreum]|jgi:nucleotide-binding universal stress UspA family protein|uniref:Universal stress protein n=1 Tax=Halosimplex litoreum TaxID=1198301 RepID=A0A7T3FYD7_9EURY|nr:universal stress protein [Halosimplex litoreum]QPV63003.1 universal stress protein [Halosimplex litoreum]